MKNILIGGCSFSERKSNLWTAWTDILENNFTESVGYNIHNVAHSSYGQSRIAESVTENLIKNDFNYDFVFVQWSAVSRAYATSEKHFLTRILNQNEVDFVAHVEEYMADSTGWNGESVTSRLHQVSNEFYKHSLMQIFLLKSLLDYKNVNYVMFWGWQQIDDKIYENNKFLIDKIYDEKFIRFGTHGGMLEYLIENLGEDTTKRSTTDFHPSTIAHKFFYDNIILPYMNIL